MIITYHNGKQFELIEQVSDTIWWAYLLHNGQRVLRLPDTCLYGNRKIDYIVNLLTKVES